ncbi:hypothetical protein [uncultured Draconibacterium sp.]|uniref:hypothetical protein n=1 Tax=uncultured Draconibacterium sp. TaxID=1573823 RepID=UPI0025CD6A16|nr:hypothetical protein [uncultured Draconibacterium sp.]
MTQTKDKHRKLMTLLSKAGVDEETRHDLVYAWTCGRTKSTTGLYDNEIDDIIWKLQNDGLFSSNVKRSANAINELAIKEKRSIVLAIAQKVGIHEGTSFTKFNAFMKERSVLKKQLTKYTFEELTEQLIPQFKSIEANFEKSKDKAFNKAWHEHYKIPEITNN